MMYNIYKYILWRMPRMKNLFVIFVLAILMMGCLSMGETQNFAEVIGKEWRLAEVYINGADTQFRRAGLPNDPRVLFTLSFDGQNVSGTGAPNIFSGPCTLGENQTINIGNMRSTLMASIFEPANLSEHNYYSYLQNAYAWKLVGSSLELQSKTQDGRDVRLVFIN